MGVNYLPVIWNRNKKNYDLILWLGILVMAAFFVVLQLLMHPDISFESLLIRTTSLTAIILLHIILMIGPLTRLNERFLPLLYNRRHLGVSFFLIASVHGIFSIMQFHSLGDVNPIVSVFISNTKYNEISQFPFQVLGFLALVIFFQMAITSHDFWLKNLGKTFWKLLHMKIYLAYGLVILHVALGILQYDSHPFYWTILILGFVLIASLHLIAGYKQVTKIQSDKTSLGDNGFYEICALEEIPDDCAKTLFIHEENIAIFRYDGKVSAVNNVCRHQMGPLGEGKIINECITCPWHGYQYRPDDGQSPPPFNEKIETYKVKILQGNVWVNPTPEEPGTYIEPAVIQSDEG